MKSCNVFRRRVTEPNCGMATTSARAEPLNPTGSHCQTPITNGKGKLDADFITWRDQFCRHLLDGWLKGQRGAKSLYAVIELGPKGSGYALDCFPDVWKDAIVARGEVEKIWQGLIKQRGK